MAQARFAANRGALADCPLRTYIRAMGTNRRYGSDLTDAAVNEALIRPCSVSLSPAEVGATNVPEAPAAIPVEAWVRFPESAIRVQGRAIAWTDRAVWVEFTLRDGSTHRAWAWASAVSRR